MSLIIFQPLLSSLLSVTALFCYIFVDKRIVFYACLIVFVECIRIFFFFGVTYQCFVVVRQFFVMSGLK